MGLPPLDYLKKIYSSDDTWPERIVFTPERRRQVADTIKGELLKWKHVSVTFERPMSPVVDERGYIVDRPGNIVLIEIQVMQTERLEENVETPDVSGESQAE